jgi:amino-acid N-acetyltransferase
VSVAVAWRLKRPEFSDWRRLRELLADAGLPTEGVSAGCGRFLVAVDPSGRVRGGVGLEGDPPDGLLRSLVVERDCRGTGAGALLLHAAETTAMTAGFERLYLLTTTAALYFDRHGYRRFARDEAPPTIRQTREFTRLCPAEAVAMYRKLDDRGAEGARVP